METTVTKDGQLKYMRSVFLQTGKFLSVSFLTGGVTSYWGLLTPLSPTVRPASLPGELSKIAAFGLAVGSVLGGLYYTHKLTRSYQAKIALLEMDPKSEGVRELEGEASRFGYLLHACLGPCLSGVLSYAPTLTLPALVTTASLTSGPVLAALLLPNRMLKYGSALGSALLGLLACSFLAALAKAVGLPLTGTLLERVELGAGVLVCAAMSAYYTDAMAAEYQRGRSSVAYHGAAFSLNFLDLFVRMMEIFIRIEKYRKEEEEKKKARRW